MDRKAVRRVAEAHRKQAGYGAAPKVFLHDNGRGSFYLWTSFAGFGRSHDITSPLQQWDKTLNKLSQQLASAAGDSEARIYFERSDVYFECSKSQPREMVASTPIRAVQTDPQQAKEALTAVATGLRITWQQMPN